MCGIVGIAARKNVVPLLIAGLRALEYRGYDSAGLALLTPDGLRRLRTPGKVRELQALYDSAPVSAQTGIAHTRWATHGVPSERNAHPHTSRERVSVVHNGIIENHETLREELTGLGYRFDSDTDTEVVAHLIEHHLQPGTSLLQAVQTAVARFEGAYAIAVVAVDAPHEVVGARRGSPMVVGVGEGSQYLASDVYALLGETRRFIYLNDGDMVHLTPDRIEVLDQSGAIVSRPVKEAQFRPDAVERGQYAHYMLKEIHEQPQAIADTLEGRLARGRILTEIFGPNARDFLKQLDAVQIVACGSSNHAAQVARYWIESLAGVPCMAEIASEYRYRQAAVPANTLLVTVSQSGETSDTLAALQHASTKGYLARLAICNVPESSLVRASELVLMTRAGPEIGVASTKAFITQLVALAMLALEIGRAKGMDDVRYREAVRELEMLPHAIQRVLALDDQIKRMAQEFGDKKDALFLGRGVQFPIAMEGALKLKEISYIHAEAYPAGELKHGPLALVDEDMPVIAVAPNDELLEKLKSNIQEVRARGGQMFVFADEQVAAAMSHDRAHVIALPSVGAFVAPMLYTVPMQLLAYHVAVLKGTDVDQPRNLAKSVTVE
ncbi:MAG: glutamine--fructose-6-phosphate transaminase (isomerizing) [Rhodanobacteraceae bacterium]|nr:glutamine--fructose-6-phosphate transaminase (isomerizing) [Rhodanobacteraceae bacterium]